MRTVAVVVTAAIAGALGVATIGCSRNVPQDRSSGEDGRVKNARPIVLENGEARIKGIVTYPGGDRVDWRKVELPPDKPGALSLRLSWIPPRPGLGLGIDVFDAYGRQVASSRGSRASRSRRSTRRTRKADIAGAKGTYFIRVYAPERGDAGAYTLSVAYAAIDPPDRHQLDPASIPDPPRLPAVPADAVPCDPDNWDKTNPKCKDVCPNPPNMALKQCQNTCPLPHTVDVPACWKIMECPTPPDKRVAKCKGVVPECAAGQPVTNNCLPPPPPKPIRARIVNVNQITSDTVEIRLDRGTLAGITRGWRGQLLGKNGKRIPQSNFTVTRVGEKTAYGTIKMRSDDVTANQQVELSPP